MQLMLYFTSRRRFLKEGINYTMYNTYPRDKSAILGITIPVIKMGSRKYYLSYIAIPGMSSLLYE